MVVLWAYKRPPLAVFDVVRPHAAVDKRAAATADAPQLFRQAADSKQRASAVTEALRVKMSRALAIEVEDVGPRKRLTDCGVDSLMAVELCNWVWWNFRASVAVFEIMDAAMDIQGVGQLVAHKVE